MTYSDYICPKIQYNAPSKLKTQQITTKVRFTFGDHVNASSYISHEL